MKTSQLNAISYSAAQQVKANALNQIEVRGLTEIYKNSKYKSPVNFL